MKKKGRRRRRSSKQGRRSGKVGRTGAGRTPGHHNISELQIFYCFDLTLIYYILFNSTSNTEIKSFNIFSSAFSSTSCFAFLSCL
jgi:hypothetical protein